MALVYRKDVVKTLLPHKDPSVHASQIHVCGSLSSKDTQAADLLLEILLNNLVSYPH